MQRHIWSLIRRHAQQASTGAVGTAAGGGSRWVHYTPRDPGNYHNTSTSEIMSNLAQTYRAHFPSKLNGPRLIGREAEFPVVYPDGSIGNVERVLAVLDEAGDMKLKMVGDAGLFCKDYEYSLEVGVGTVEIVLRPCKTLHEMRELHEEAVGKLVRAAESVGMLVLGHGTQPVQRASRGIMVKRERYKAMAQTLGDDHWLWFTLTASDQVHVDIAETELLRIVNMGNLLSPVMVALMGNSAVLHGQPAEFVSSREGAGERMDPVRFRHGMARGPFYSVLDYIMYLCRFPYLLRPRTQEEVWQQKAVLQAVSPSQTFRDHLAAQGYDWEAFKVHDHYIWGCARPRTEQRTVEMRCMCQQPGHEHMVASALSLGLIEASQAIMHDNNLHDVLNWKDMRALFRLVTKHGMSDAALHGVPGLDGASLIQSVLEHCYEGLVHRGFGEEDYLLPLFDRLTARQNPGQVARGVLEDEGIGAFVQHCKVDLDNLQAAVPAQGEDGAR